MEALKRGARGAAVVLALLGAPAAAQALPGFGRVSLFAQTFRTSGADGTTSSFSEVWAGATLRSASAEEGGFEYGLDFRGATYPSTERDTRLSVWDAWLGARASGGTFSLKAGQMWLTDLGGLGALGGLAAEVSPRSSSSLGRFRLGIFAGLEPNSWEAGFVKDVRKTGGYLALDGERGRKHVLGYVLVKNSGVTERSVVTLTNFIPGGSKFFLYQAAEYDLAGPGGTGSPGGLTYFFTNVRWAPIPRLELLATFHRGLSIDTRTITQDQLNGRPVDPRLLEGFLFESVGGRVTVEVFRSVRVYGGWAREKNNRDAAPSDRIAAGLWASNLFRSGFDLTVSDNRYQSPQGPYDAWYVSLGRNLGSRLYLSADYSNSVSVLRLTDSGGVVVESRPRTRRFGLNGVANIGRSLTLLLTAEQIRDDTSKDNRGMAGLSFRF